MNTANEPWSKAARAMPGPTAPEQDDPNVPSDGLGGLNGQRLASSPYLSQLLEEETRTIASIILSGRVQLPPRRCVGAVTLSVNEPHPPAATAVASEADGTTLYFTPVCVIDLHTNAPICALYCLNIHRVFMQGEAGGMVDLSPTALEVLGGRAANRKWRVSLKVLRMMAEGDVEIHIGLGKWLDVMGLDTWLPEEVCTVALAHAPSHSLTHSLTHSLIHSLIHSLVLQAVSRVGSKQSSRNPTPAGSPSKRKRSTHSRAGTMAGVVEDFDVLLDVITRPVRVVASGQILWGLYAGPAAATGDAAGDSSVAMAAQPLAVHGAESDVGHEKKGEHQADSHLDRLGERHGQDDTDSDNALIYLPSLMPSSGST